MIQENVIDFDSSTKVSIHLVREFVGDVFASLLLDEVAATIGDL